MQEYHLLKRLVKKIQEKHQHHVEQYHLGAIILDRRGNILSTGFNSSQKTHPKQLLYNKYKNNARIYLHAEIDALVKCKAKPYVMIIARINRKGELRIAKPCDGCIEAIRHSDLKKIYFTNNFGELVLLDLNEKALDYK